MINLRNPGADARLSLLYATWTTTVNNSTVLVSSNLGFYFQANAKYLIRAYLLISTNNLADAKFGWTYPVNFTMKWGMPTFTGWDAVTSTSSGTALAAQSDTKSVGGQATALTIGVQLIGVTTGGDTSGNVTLTFAQLAADASDSKLLPGSCIEVVRFY